MNSKHQHSQSESFRKVLKAINLVLVILDVVVVIGIMVDDVEGFFEALLLHSIFLLPSILYQVNPSIRHYILYQIYSVLIGILSLVAFAYNWPKFIQSMETKEFLINLFLLLFFTGPAAIIGVSHLFLIMAGTKNTSQNAKNQEQYITLESQPITYYSAPKTTMV